MADQLEHREEDEISERDERDEGDVSPPRSRAPSESGSAWEYIYGKMKRMREKSKERRDKVKEQKNEEREERESRKERLRQELEDIEREERRRERAGREEKEEKLVDTDRDATHTPNLLDIDLVELSKVLDTVRNRVSKLEQLEEDAGNSWSTDHSTLEFPTFLVTGTTVRASNIKTLATLTKTQTFKQSTDSFDTHIRILNALISSLPGVSLKN